MIKTQLENVITWMKEKLTEGNYKTIEIIGDRQLDRAPNLTCLAHSGLEKTDFLDIPKDFFQQIFELLKNTQISEKDTSYLEIKIIAPNEIKHIKLISRAKEHEEKVEIAKKEYIASFPEEPFGEDFAKLVADSLEELGELTKTIDPRDNTGFVLWRNDQGGFDLGTYGFGQRESLKNLPNKQEFIEWMSQESPRSLLELGLPFKSVEIIDLIKIQRIIQQRKL